MRGAVGLSHVALLGSNEIYLFCPPLLPSLRSQSQVEYLPSQRDVQARVMRSFSNLRPSAALRSSAHGTRQVKRILSCRRAPIRA